MTLRQLILRLDRARLARAQTLLERAGAHAVSVSDAADHALYEPEPGATPIWPEVELAALFDDDSGDLEAVAALLAAALDSEVALRALDDADWQAAQRQPVTARRFGTRLELVPAEQAIATGERSSVRLHMGLAFGTGQHPTTALCLEWLDAHVAQGDRVLDYGCGSGVLAIAALKLGAAYAWAVDNDPQALVATRNNAELNDVANIWIGSPSQYRGTELDLIAANILAGPLMTQAPGFARQLRPGGRIVLSGILDAQRDAVEQSYARYFTAFDVAHSDGWIRLSALRNTGPSPARGGRLSPRAAP